MSNTPMARNLLPLLMLLLGVSGCIARERLNSDCSWTHDAPRHLDLDALADRQHLVDDAQLAEELAIRYADTHLGRAYARPDAYVRARDGCMATLFGVAAHTHGVPADLVRRSVDRPRWTFDAAAFLSFACLYLAVSWVVVRRLRHRFLGEQRTVLAALLVASVVLGVGGVMAGEEWWGLGQSIRLGTSHASYRAFRNPWRQHRAELLAGGVALVWLIVPLATRSRGRNDRSR